MGKILLVIDHSDPDEKSFRYAVQLCRSVQAQLSILQFGEMAAVAPDQQTLAPGEKLAKMIRESEEKGVRCSWTVNSGQTDREVVRHVEANRDILLAVYDCIGASGERRNKKKEQQLARDLLIPIVRVHAGRLFRKLKIAGKILMEVKHMGLTLKKLGNVFSGKNKRATGKEKPADSIGIQTPQQVQEEEEARLVVVGNESEFSDGVVEYALEMAKRMNYQIIALNTVPLACDTFRRLSSSRKQVCGEFESISMQNVKAFEAAAQDCNIPFTHVVKFVEIDDALEELQREFGEIGFIVSEPQGQAAVQDQDRNEKRPEAEMCVYALR